MIMSDSGPVQRHLSETALDQALKAADSGKHARRLGFIKNLYQGDSVSDAIAREGRSTSTGYRWRKKWNNGGVDGLLPDYGGGRPPKLSPAAETAFLDEIAQRHPVATAIIEAILKTEFDVEYAADYLPQKLESIGLTYQPPARERVDRQEILEAAEWDDKAPVENTGRHPYNEQSSRTEAGWFIPD